MWPWGHLAVAYLLSTGYARARFDQPLAGSSVFFLAVGSQLPDLIDKPFAWYLGVLPTGRSVAHSLLFVIPLGVAVFLLAARFDRRQNGAVFGIGLLSHPLADALPAFWSPEATANFLLWPVVPVTAYEGTAPGILELFRSTASEPFFVVELLLVAAAALSWHRDGYPGVGTLVRASERLG